MHGQTVRRFDIVSVISVFVICRYIYFYCGYVLRLCAGMHFISFEFSSVLFSTSSTFKRVSQQTSTKSSIHSYDQSSIHPFIHPSVPGHLGSQSGPQSSQSASHIFEQPRQNKKKQKKKRLNILPKIIKNKRTFHKRVIKTAQIYANFYNLYVHFLLVPSLDSFGCCEGYCLPLCWFVQIIFTIYDTFSVVFIFSLPFL